jgi:integrase
LRGIQGGIDYRLQILVRNAENNKGVDISDVDFENRVVCVRRALVWLNGGGFIFTAPETSRSRRSIPLSTSAIDELKKHKRRQGERRLMLGEQYENHDLVFATEMGNTASLAQSHATPFQAALAKGRSA